MSYQVIARKWRPQKFNEIVYQDHISRTLTNSIRNGRISHAYLFSGPRGVGKTTMARVLAKALNCIEGPTDNPCGVCEHCVEIRNGNSFDVIEIDGASNRGIENIRELRENVNFAPVKTRYKVYIVDEVHMLTEPAFNALLKTLEEPPAHVVFVFATTEFHKIPETIISRCQKHFFKKLSIDSIVAHLSHIVKNEGGNIDDGALFSIARAADGSMRDAQSLLDQLLSFSEGNVRENDALAILGVVPLPSYIDLLDRIAAGDRAGVINEIHRVEGLGIDLPRYVAGFMNIMRALRLVMNGVTVRDILGFSEEETQDLQKISDKYCDEELSAIFKVGSDLQNELRFSVNERIAVEMAFLDMVMIKATPSVASILRKIEDVSCQPDGLRNQKKKLNENERKDAPLPHQGRDDTPPRDEHSPQSSEHTSEGSLHNTWATFLASLTNERQFLYFKLNEAGTSFGDNEVVLNFPAGDDKGYYSRILDKREINFIKDELRKRMGREIKVVVRTLETGEAPPPPVEENIPVPEAEMLKNPEVEELEIMNPAVEKVKDMFHGKIIKKGEE